MPTLSPGVSPVPPRTPARTLVLALAAAALVLPTVGRADDVRGGPLDTDPATMPDTRPVDPDRKPTSLSEPASGVESAIPVAVQRSIDGDPLLRDHRITVAGDERRNVTLSGTVPTTELRERATRLAMAVSGVQHVHNEIVVPVVPAVPAGPAVLPEAEAEDLPEHAGDPARIEPNLE